MIFVIFVTVAQKSALPALQYTEKYSIVFKGNLKFFCSPYHICGLDIYNTCEGIHDVDYQGNPYTGEQHSNPPNARFCETCGAPTAFLNQKILPTYEEYLKRIEQEQHTAPKKILQSFDDDDIPF